MLKFIAVGLVLLAGCAPQKPAEPKPSITEAQKNFEAKCREEFDLHVVTRLAGETLYIYLPTKEPLFDYESQKEKPPSDQKPAKFALQYVDGQFNDGRFVFEYDVIERTKTKQEDYGYSSSYTDSYVKDQNNMFTAINDTFFDAEAKEGEKLPRMFVIIITDIKKGIETKATFYLQDFKRYMSGDLPYDEYMKRFLADTKGGQNMIGDETGSHIEYRDIPMTEFLTKQIVNRINFKFQRSDLGVKDDYDSEMVSIVADTLRYYKFTDFTTVQVSNLRQNKKLLFEKPELKSFGDDAEDTPAKGKLIRIRFDKGETTITE